MAAPTVTIDWNIIPPTGVDPPTSTLATGSSSFTPRPQPTDPSDGTTSSAPTQVYNQDNSQYYQDLLSSLNQAKDGLNARLTEWKDAIGDKEKSKEVLPPGTAGKQGMGKAMMMVQAAKEADGRAGHQSNGQQSLVGLPTDDQESDEDSDLDTAIPE